MAPFRLLVLAALACKGAAEDAETITVQPPCENDPATTPVSTCKATLGVQHCSKILHGSAVYCDTDTSQCLCGDGYCPSGSECVAPPAQEDCVTQATFDAVCDSDHETTPVGTCNFMGVHHCSYHIHGMGVECIDNKCYCGSGTCPVNNKTCVTPPPPSKLDQCTYDADNYKYVCSCNPGRCSVDGSTCADWPEAAPSSSLNVESAARKVGHVAMWTIVIVLVVSCLCVVGIIYGIYALCCKEADGCEYVDMGEKLLA